MTSRKLGLALAIALATGTALADPSPAKKALIDKIVAMQQKSLADALAAGIVQGPLPQLAQGVRAAIQQLPAEKREAAAKAADAEVKKFVEENHAYLKDKFAKAVPNTASALLDERFNEDELKQIVVWSESPVSQKFGGVNVELQKALAQKVMAEAGPTLQDHYKALQANLAKQLGVQPPAAAASKPATSTPAKPAASAAPKK